MLDWPEAPPLELDDFVRVPSFDMHGDLALSLVHRVRRACRSAGRDRRGRHARHGHDGGDGLPRRPAARHGDTGGAHRRAAGRGRARHRRAAQPAGRDPCRRLAAGPRPRRGDRLRRRDPRRPRGAEGAHQRRAGIRLAGLRADRPRRRRRRRLPAAARGGRRPLPLPEHARPGRPDPAPRRAATRASCARRSSPGARAIVLEGTGRGNANDEVVAAVARGGRRRASTSSSAHADAKGRVEPVYGRGGGRDLAEAGALFAGDLAGPKTRVLLQVALGAGVEPATALAAAAG